MFLYLLFCVSRSVQNITGLYCLVESVLYKTSQPAPNEIKTEQDG